MDSPTSPRRFPWGLVFPFVFLLVVICIVYRLQMSTPWSIAGYLLLASSAIFVVGRSLLGSLWGMVMALTLLTHPVYLEWGNRAPGEALLGEGLKLAGLAALVLAWQELFQSRNRLWFLMGIGLASTLFVTLAWLISADAGLVTTLTTAGGWLVGGMLVFFKQRVQGPKRPALLNGVVSVLSAVVVLVGSFLLIPYAFQATVWLDERGADGVQKLVSRSLENHQALFAELRSAVYPRAAEDPFPGFTEPELHLWAWPFHWAVLAFMAFGLLRTVWRGWLQWKKQRPALSWLLTLFALAVLFSYATDAQYFKDSAQYLPFATSAILLAWYGLADWVFGVGERIRLEPPEEQTDKVVQE